MITLKEAFAAKYPNYLHILDYFEEANGIPATWDNISRSRLEAMVDYMRDETKGGLSPNSANQYCVKLKAVINRYRDDVDIPDFGKSLSPKKVKSTATWLTDDELNKLAVYKPESLTEQIVKTQFLLGAYTGARHSDFMTFDFTNVSDGYLSYVSIKTHIQATIPLKPIVRDLLNNMVHKELTLPTFNNTLRKMARSCGITTKVRIYKAGKNITAEKCDLISSHTARRSFASNLYLHGCDLLTISKMMGHTTTEITNKYIVCGIRTHSEQVLQYFA
jgi:integrase